MVKKELRKFSQWFWKVFLKWYDGGGEHGIRSKMISKVEVSFPSQNVNFPYIWRNFWSFYFFAPCLEDFGVLMLFVEKITSSKTYFQMAFNILAVDAYSRMKLCTPTWLNRDYGDWGVVDILAVDAYSGVDVWMPIFMGEACN
jgi:hypothetical protein